jgi:hypothetical protein
MTQPDWDDDRIAAAFHARFDHPAPPTLAPAIHGAIAGTAPARFHLLGGLPGRSIAAAAVVVVLVGTVALGLGGFDRLGGPSVPSASPAAASPGASATPTSQAVPGSVVGLPIIEVPDAIAIRDGGVDDREIAVLGWFGPAPMPSCPFTPTVNPLQLQCPDTFVWFTRDPESLIHVGEGSSSLDPPVGPALNPDLDGLDRSWYPPLPVPGQDGRSKPVDVVFVGHFDDRRADQCPEAEQSACRDRFVVDSVALVAGRPQPRSEMREVRQAGMVTGSSMADIEAIVANEAPDSPILSMLITDGAEGLARIEPSLASGQQGLIDRPVVWVVRVLESERMITYIIVDGTDAIYEMTQEGHAVPVGGSTGEPVPTPGPWPPVGATVIALTSPVGAGEPPVEVAVVDESGRLTGVAEKGTVDASTHYFDGRFGAFEEPGKPGRVHLQWVGGICDSRTTVTVAADLGSITFDMGPQPANCDSIGVGRELVLDFDGTVDVSAIELRDVADAPAPVATSPAYQLDCGPLGPDTCEQKAAAVVAANATGSPTKRLESITFTDECGSYTVLFDDGTGMTASIDCILGGELRRERFLALERSLNDRLAAERQASAPS